jgi:hypothetical protein
MTELIQQDKLPDTEACSALLERVLASTPLRRAQRLQKLLVYVGQRVLKDNCNHITEQEIGSAIFGRPDTYDTSVDNIVRVYASDLRKHLKAYFDSEGLHETVILEIPPGSYLPVFRHRPIETKLVAELPISGNAPLPEPPHDIPAAPANSSQLRRARAGLIIAGLITVALAAGCVALWMQNRAMYRSLYPWRNMPAVASLWSVFIDSNRDTDVVLSDDSFCWPSKSTSRGIYLTPPHTTGCGLTKVAKGTGPTCTAC